ncbi:hypothetical protein Y5W_01035 [Alcanivorax sp. 521-1]|uniref:Uncharacterized protein n=1 Tax=Alloalcanivorax profundimaris TaxID=2735259 RepID=A0ABS0ANN4_9GAMM|nr:hypothetical protein [Alloalcanivorax profundimaris]
MRAITRGIGIDTLAYACSVIATFQRQLPDQEMRKGMEHGISDAGVAFVRVQTPRIPPPLMATSKHTVHFLDRIQAFPCFDRQFIELDEDTFPVYLTRGHPVRVTSGQTGSLGTFSRFT